MISYYNEENKEVIEMAQVQRKYDNEYLRSGSQQAKSHHLEKIFYELLE